MNQSFFVGVVEDRYDPLFLGRCKVRVVGVHTDNLSELPTDDLPWAFPMTSITSASMSGIGDAPVGPVEGTWVVVFFKDGSDMQQPVMIGTLPGIPEEKSNKQAFSDPNGIYPKEDMLNEADTNRLARVQKIDKTIVTEKINTRNIGITLGNSQGGKWNQSPIPYGSKYPFNHVYESESGNILEFDDTEYAERINLHHKKGTFFEIDANGSQVNKIIGNGYTIVDRDGFVMITGQCVVNVQGSATVSISKDAHLDVGGNVNVLAADKINLASKSKITLQTESDIQMSCKKMLIEAEELSANISQKVDILAGADINLHGNNTYIQSSTAAPTEIDYDIWSYFDEASLFEMPTIPSYEENVLMDLEGLTMEEIQQKVAEIGLSDAPSIKDSLIPTEASTTIAAPIYTTDKILPVSCLGGTKVSKNTLLSKYFTMGQLTMGRLKPQYGLSEDDIICNLQAVAVNCLDKIKEKYPTMKINSGLRNENTTTSISQHCLGEAIDIGFDPRPSKTELYDIAADIASMINFDQIILEYHGPISRWIHVSFKRNGNNRRKLLTTFTGSSPYKVGIIKPMTNA